MLALSIHTLSAPGRVLDTDDAQAAGFCLDARWPHADHFNAQLQDSATNGWFDGCYVSSDYPGNVPCSTDATAQELATGEKVACPSACAAEAPSQAPAPWRR